MLKKILLFGLISIVVLLFLAYVPLRNSGALWGLISVIILSVVLYIKNKRTERRWTKYADDKIYRPDEWENKLNTSANKSINSGQSDNEATDSIRPRIKISRKHKSVSIKPHPSNRTNKSRNKKSRKTIKSNSIAIPNVEPVED